MERTVAVMLVHAVGVAPFWKDGVLFYIVNSGVPTWAYRKVCGGGVFLLDSGAYLRGVVDESLQSSLTLVGDRGGKDPVGEKSGGGGGKRRGDN